MEVRGLLNTEYKPQSVILASVISRNQNAHSLVKGTTSFIKTYLTPSSITKNLNNINNILEQYLEELEQTKQITKKKKRSVHSACKLMVRVNSVVTFYTMNFHNLEGFVNVSIFFLAGESPAHEVIQYRGQGKGYFGHSRNC